MNLAILKTRSVIGINAPLVYVEIHLSNGLPGFSIVGLPQTAVKESKDRVRSAIINSNFQFPCRKIIVNLAPADLPKVGCGFDLPIAIGILTASGQIPISRIHDKEFIGELALDGGIRGINTIVPVAIAAKKDNQKLIISQENANDAAIVSYENIYAASNLCSVYNYLIDNGSLEQIKPKIYNSALPESTMDWSDIKGQKHAKLAMQVAACGGHSLLLNGPPGSGKTMLARRLNTILPELVDDKALECIAIKSISGSKPDYNNWKTPPFRAPHHTASPVALVGGGNPPRPGEISLAHNGVLFLDELPEFNRQVLETLREPLESGMICISRAANQIDFPANFQLIAAMNPCPCGQLGNIKANCTCSPEKINRYLNKLSAPLLDRIDMQVTLNQLSQEELLSPQVSTMETSFDIRTIVTKARQKQYARQKCLNAYLSNENSDLICNLSSECKNLLKESMSNLKLSARAIHRLIKVARTIADINIKDNICKQDIEQALSFRQNIRSLII